MSELTDLTGTYPLGENQPEHIRSRTGLNLTDITLTAVREGDVGSADLTIHTDTLRMQANIAAEAGYHQLAQNLRRAAELVNIPDDQLLRIYEALRPKRSTYQELSALSEEIATEYGAVENAHFIREAAEAYYANGLLRRDKE